MFAHRSVIALDNGAFPRETEPDSHVWDDMEKVTRGSPHKNTFDIPQDRLLPTPHHFDSKG